MTTFTYKAKDRSGNTLSGTVEANDERAAAAIIREQGGLPMEIRPVGFSAARPEAAEAGSAVSRFIIYPLWTGVNMKALALFYRQLATLLGAGMTLSEALGSAGRRTGGRLGGIIAEAASAVQNGRRLSDTLARHPRVFSPLQMSLVRAGEASGLLDSMIERIASYLEYELSVQSRLARAMFYPLLIFLFIILIPHVPALVLKGPAAFGLSLWSSLRVWLPWAILVIAIAKLLLQFESARLVWDSIKIVPPMLGTLARKVAMSRFSRALASLYSAGMPIGTAIGVSADACANIAIGRKIKSAVPEVQSGENFTEALERTGALMPIVIDMLATGEKTGSLDTVLQKAADYLDDETDTTIHKTGIALFVLAILAAGIVVLMMVLAFYMGYIGDVMEKANQ